MKQCKIKDCESEIGSKLSMYCKGHRNMRAKSGFHITKEMKPTWVVWNSLRRRGELNAYGINPNWRTFEGFLKDMGLKPDGYRFKKLSNYDGYHKDNCIWSLTR